MKNHSSLKETEGLSTSQRGSIAVEAVLLVPVLVLMLVFIVAVGRVQSASLLVRQVADVSARTGSQAHIENAVARARAQGAREMAMAQNICQSHSVNASLHRQKDVASISTSVTCVVRMTGLEALGISVPSVRATSVEVIDFYRSTP